MDLHQLRIFIAVANEGNLTRASQQLYLSQPAVSAQIKALEEELGLNLFRRGSRGMQLTSAGEALFEEASFALMAASKVTARAQSLKNGIYGECRLGTITEPTILRLGEFLTYLMSHHNGLRLSLSQGISGEIIDRLLERKIDAGYVIGPVDDSRVESLDLSPIQFRVVGPRAWADELHSAEWTTLAAYPWLSTPPRCSFHRLASQMFERLGVVPRTIIEADQESTLSRLVASGIGLTLLREDVAYAAQSAGEVFVWERGLERSYLRFIYLKSDRSDPKVAAMLDAVRAAWRRPPPLSPDSRENFG